MNIRNKLLGGALSLSAAAIIVKIIGVIYKIPLSYMIGDEGMGYFNSAYTIYGFFYMVLTAGVPKAVAMVVARMDNGLRNNLNVLYRKLVKLFLVLGITVTGAFLLLSGPFSSMIGSKKSFYTLVAIAPSILFIALASISKGFLNGLSFFKPIAISQVIEAVSKLGLGLLFATVALKLGWALPFAAAFSVLGITIGSLFSMIYLSRYIKRSMPINADTVPICVSNCKDFIKEIILIAAPLTLSSVVLSISGILDLTLIINGLKSVGYSEDEATALFGNYSTLVVPMLNLVSSVLMPISVAALPELVSLNKKDSGEDSVLNSGINIIIFLATPCMLIYNLFSFDILDLLFSSSSSVIAAELLSIISPAVILLPLLNLVNTALESQGKIMSSVVSLSVGAVFKFLTTYFLIKNPSVGINAVPIGTVLSYAVSLIISLTVLSGVTKSVMNGLLRYIILGVIIYIPSYLAIYVNGIVDSSVLCMLIAIIPATALYFIFNILLNSFKKVKT